MRKSLGSKRQEMSDTDIQTITRAFGDFTPVSPTALDKPAEAKSTRGRPAANPKAEPEKNFAAKVFKTHEFGYRRITIERPLRLSWQFSDERLTTLRFASGALEAPVRWIYETHGSAWTDDSKDYGDGDLAAQETEIRAALKADFPELKEKRIKDLFASATWRDQRDLLLKARQLQAKLGTEQHDDLNAFDAALAATGLRLDAKEKKQITAAVSWKNPAAAKVVKKLHKTGKPDPFYGLFSSSDVGRPLAGA